MSEFSKKEIMENYNVEEQKITVTYSSAEHIKEIIPDDNIINKLNLKNKNFNFSLGSKSPHKNHKFILECAKQNPNMLFVISGNDNEKIFKNKNNEKKLENIIYTGYLTDNELVSLYKNCKFFIFPSLYEGFGVPPLEAITMGCTNIILSDIPVLKEIYGNNAIYVDTLKEYDIEQYKSEKHKNYTELLNKYSWKNVEKIIINQMKE